ncbi:probable ATP-dependent RNA helicase DDX10 [Agrilus planipennis]|uniref:ATP-dependent RNA helicase n=1 Tax=Agrilus planipennis TaxID=224129 RepID=A0A1W4WYX0_AGRPL|nr:probable ATP-dependent RNA helicase DDX10 [Agrilus planipennis]
MTENKAHSNKKKKNKVKVYSSNQKKAVPATIVIERLKTRYNEICGSKIEKFSDLPLSKNTLKGLNESNYRIPSDIQRETIGLALQGKDILGAAQTGSGKTLAFLLPVLETLFCLQWTRLDGLGALIITPTRELAYQIFETIRKVGRYHDFSVGLIIGGKDLKFERKRMDQCNIIICTPGRLLQHMDENPLFDCCNMKVLVLDEADRCLDMGFEETMNAIIANLPLKRQTLLFSATQTKSIRDLARLSLKDPSYVSVHEKHKHSTPEGLQQSYVVCELHEKVPIVWSFIRNHLKKKCIVFFSSCKQVKYMYEIFCKLRPGTTVLALYGTLHQMRRMNIYETFCRKQSAILFSTDLAARGLDFPEVHWVLQADCPEDSATYVHRVGRTARYFRGGESLLLLLPSEEEGMIEALNQRKVPINKIEINPNKLQNPVRKMEAFLAKDPSLKESAQRAFVSYIKYIFLMKNKKVFDVQTLDTDAYSRSLGLAVAPRIRFLQRHNARVAVKQKEPHRQEHIKQEVDYAESNDRTMNKADVDDQNVVSEDKVPFYVSDNDDSDDDGILRVKRINHELEISEKIDFIQDKYQGEDKKKKTRVVTKAAAAKKLLRKKIMPNKKIIFDDEGEAVVSSMKEKRSEIAREYENEDLGGIDLEKAKLVLKEEDKFDKQLFKEKVKAKHKEKKMKLKQQTQQRREEEEEKDGFETNSEEEQLDLTWLPDPDKIYGNKEEDGTNKKDNNSEYVVEALKQIVLPQKGCKKRKSIKLKKNSEVKSKKAKIDLEGISSSLSVNEAEELALLLLNKK